MNKTEQIIKVQEKVQALKKKTMNVRSPQSKIVHKLLTKTPKWRRKEVSDKREILEIVQSVKEGYSLKMISNKFDSPNIISMMLSNFNIEEVYISTWAVTDIGIERLKKLSDKGIKVTVLLDQTHSYKWTFESGAYKILDNVQFVFTQNHSKFQLFKLKNQNPINFIGSFNLSNNPRYENIEINRSVAEFDFYKDFLINVSQGSYDSQKTLF